MGGWLIFGFIVVIVALVVAIITANEFGDIAEAKGYDKSKYACYAFFFGIMGALIVVALPDRNKKVFQKDTRETPEDTTQYEVNRERWVRKAYGRSNGDFVRPTEAEEGQWKCAKCGAVNENYVTTCVCGQYKRDN